MPVSDGVCVCVSERAEVSRVCKVLGGLCAVTRKTVHGTVTRFLIQEYYVGVGHVCVVAFGPYGKPIPSISCGMPPSATKANRIGMTFNVIHPLILYGRPIK